jgi:hypothetical protein
MSAIATVLLASSVLAAPAIAAPFFFSTGNPDGKMATAARPGTGGAFEIESADDFILTSGTRIDTATFTGLLPSGSTANNVKSVVVEVYRVFPKDSDVGRTSGPPTFSTSQVPTRVNSPSDVALLSRESGSTLSFTTQLLDDNFTASNTVQPGGIHPLPGIFTGGNGPVTGDEVQFNIDFTQPILLGADHFFFVPQVELDNGNFLWLSAPRPILPPGTPLMGDLQSWTRDPFLDPDWLRIGTDITHEGPFNATFSLTGEIPEPGTITLLLGVIAALGWKVRKRT